MITYSKTISITFLFVGIILLMQLVLPIVSFKLWEIGQNFESNPLISPQENNKISGISVKNDDNFPIIFSERSREINPNYSKFSLSLPSLKLLDMDVFLDSNDLGKGLVSLPGSALPGEKGNVFISGHSAASQLFSFKQVYFSHLMGLKKDSEIDVLANGTKFVYKVIQIKVVDPKDLSVVNPPDEMGRYITLMTCVPPGLNFKRLVVLGKML